MNQAIKEFLKMESAGGILLVVAAVLAMILANSPLSAVYTGFLAIPVGIQFSELVILKPLLLWINDGLMAIFFLLIGLEVKREAMEGALSSRDQAMLPAIAAVGGMAVPALIYLAFNAADPVLRQGWAIPAATDIAFALGILALLGSRVPLALKVFLLALAIIDDIGVIVIIALFYSTDLHWGSLVVAAIAATWMLVLNRRGESRLWTYMVLGAIMWIAVLKSGVHATLAGVITGFLIPLNDKEGGSPLRHLEHALHPYVAFGILPLFAFANAGVSLNGMTVDGLFSALPMGVMLGLLIGKPLGIFGLSYLSVRAGWAKLPEQTNWHSLFGVSVLCGIGFTMSMFITTLAWQHTGTQFSDWARLGILAGSLTAGLIGYFYLRMVLSVECAQEPELEY